MKKNRMMRLASGLLVAVLLTTCTISGTFAKYVTTDSASDTARVAKWGVEVTATGTLFAEQYKDFPVIETEDNDDNITVQVSNFANVEQNVVAPGTKNDTGMTFSITGTPEVDTKLTVKVTVNNDIKLAVGTYNDPTTGDTTDKVVIEEGYDYYPVVFTLKNGTTVVASGNLTVIETYLEKLSAERINANTDLGTKYGTYTLTWAWAYGTAADDNGNNIVDTDKYDTILGNAAVTSISGATTEIDFAIDITVEQID